mgnify:CR=1 FL=1
MNKRNQRIEAFINSLETVESDGCQSILLTTDMGAVGGANPGTCTNRAKACGKTTNSGVCTNFVDACVDANNTGDCRLEEIAPGIETNTTLPTCGK